MHDPKILNRLKALRESRGLSQQALAEQVGVSRQALIAIEAGRQVPATSRSLLLARALGCGVEDLFQLAAPGHLEAELAPSARTMAPRAGRVILARVRDRWVAHPIADEVPVAADGLLQPGRDHGAHTAVAPLAAHQDLERHVLVAGCAPLLGLLAHRAGRRYGDTRISWLAAGSTRALEMLRANLVHVAGLHHVEQREGDTLRLVREKLPGRSLLVVNLTRWRQGLLVPRGNPNAITQPTDLLRPELRFAHREPGSSAHALVQKLLASHGADAHAALNGPTAFGHAEVAQLVHAGAADAGLAIENVAIARGLDFVPLTEERFDLVVPRELASESPTGRLLDGLHEGAFRAEAARLPGYDDSLTGQSQVVEANGNGAP